LSEYSNNTNRVDLVFRKSRGSAASPATTQVGDYLGIIDFQGRASSSFTVGAEIFSQVEAVGGSVYGNLIFSTNDLGGGGITERIRLFNNGNFGIGTGSTDGGQKLQVNGTAAISGQIRGANIVASNLGSADAGFYGTAGADAGSGHRLALVRTDTPTGGSALLSAFGAAVVEVNATTGLNTGTRALTIDTSANATFVGEVKAATQMYAEKTGAGVYGRSVGMIQQHTTVNSTTYNVTTASAKVFVISLGSGDAALCYASYKSSTITILGSDGTIVNSSTPASGELGIYKSANDHVISFKTGSAAATNYGSWGFCFVGNPVQSIT